MSARTKSTREFHMNFRALPFTFARQWQDEMQRAHEMRVIAARKEAKTFTQEIINAARKEPHHD